MGQWARPMDWAGIEAPGVEELERLAARAFAALPEDFRNLCLDLVIRVEDFPSDDVIEEMDLESEFDLLGLFHGLGLAQSSGPATGQMPNMVFLYRRPILDYWAEHEETLGDVVTHVLVHEIAHHFGLSDEDIDRVEQATGW